MKTKLKKAYRALLVNMKHSHSPEDVRLAVNTYRQILSSTVQFLANAAISIHNFMLVSAEGCEMFLVHDFDFQYVPFHHYNWAGRNPAERFSVIRNSGDH